MKQEHAVTRGVGQEQTHRVGDTAVLADLGEGSPFRAIVELTALRNVLRLNAVFSIVTGVAMALFAERLGARLGIVDDWIAPLRAIGVGLIGCAVGLLVIGAMAAHRVVTATVPVVVCDLGWVIGTIVLIATGSFSTRGAVIGGLVAAVVLDFAILQWRALRRSLAAIERAPAGSGDMATVEAVLFRRDLPASAGALWPVMTDHELYARLARNLGGATAVTENGPGLVRQCRDTSGNTWNESCTLWDPGRRFAVTVHTDAPDYPYPLTMMQGSWGVAPTSDPDRAAITMAFAFQPSSGVKGAMMALMMNTTIRPILRRIARGWERAAAGVAG